MQLSLPCRICTINEAQAEPLHRRVCGPKPLVATEVGKTRANTEPSPSRHDNCYSIEHDNVNIRIICCVTQALTIVPSAALMAAAAPVIACDRRFDAICSFSQLC